MDDQTEAIREELGLTGEPGVTFINQSELDDEEVIPAVRDALISHDPELATAMEEWAVNQGGSRRRAGGLFQQDRYVVPTSIFEQFRTATDAAKSDDVVSNAVETTEMLAFKGVAISTGEDEEDDVAGQILDDINLKTKMRQIWRELFMVSQCYISVSWKKKTYSVKRAKTANGKKSKKKYVDIMVPDSIMVLDPCRVIPHGMFAFGDEQLLYIADSDEEAEAILGRINDPKSKESRLFIGRYEPTDAEILEFRNIIGKSHDDRDGESKKRSYLTSISSKGDLKNRLLILNPDNSWRITHTRPDYQRFADVRLVSIFEILDLKNNLRESDRVDILGNLNSIILVKKGSDEYPASANEMARTSATMRSGSKIPIIISDHRLEIEIITRKTDKTLQPERYNTLNASLTSRLYQILNSGNYCVSPDTEVLSEDGWVSYDKLNVGDLIYSMNTETGLGEWTPVKAVNVFDHDGEMLLMEGRGHSSLSTGNHRWWVERQHGKAKVKGMEFVTSDELKIFDKIPTAIESSAFPVDALYTDELVELAAWFWTEGHRMVDAPNRISISQSQSVNPDYCDRIRVCMEKVFGPEGKVADGGTWYYRGEEFHVSAHVTSTLLNLFEYKHVPIKERVTVPKRPRMDFLQALTKEQMQLFVDVCVMGDGSTETAKTAKSVDRNRWHQKDYRSVELFEYCLTMLGIPVRSRLDPSREEVGVWTVEMLSRQFASPFAAAREAKKRNPEEPSAIAEWVPYNGKVWCPTTETGTWFARRNGITFVTGNSSGTAVDDSSKLFKIIASSMEARRDEIRESIMDRLIDKIWEENDNLIGEPIMNFYPRRVSLEFDPQYSMIMFDLFNLGHISRETMLLELDIYQDSEAEKRLAEDASFKDVFTPREAVSNATTGRVLGGPSGGGGENKESYTPTNNTPNPENEKIKKDPKD